jgi:hypothetical protein
MLRLLRLMGNDVHDHQCLVADRPMLEMCLALGSCSMLLKSFSMDLYCPLIDPNILLVILMQLYRCTQVYCCRLPSNENDVILRSLWLHLHLRTPSCIFIALHKSCSSHLRYASLLIFELYPIYREGQTWYLTYFQLHTDTYEVGYGKCTKMPYSRYASRETLPHHAISMNSTVFLITLCIFIVYNLAQRSPRGLPNITSPLFSIDETRQMKAITHWIVSCSFFVATPSNAWWLGDCFQHLPCMRRQSSRILSPLDCSCRACSVVVCIRWLGAFVTFLESCFHVSWLSAL